MSFTDNQPDKPLLSKQPHIIPIFCLVGMTMTGLMSIIGFINGNNLLASVLACTALINGISLYLYRFIGKEQLSSVLLIYTLYSLMFYLVYSGGVNWTGILWLYIVAPVTIYIRGLKRGIFDTIIFLAIVAAIMAIDGVAQNYPDSFKLRFFLSFSTVTFLSAMYEYSRTKWYQHTVELTKRYQHLAHFDPLTQLSNRRHASMVLKQEYARLSRGGEAVSILLCDIDHFKNVNDKFGHCVGDTVLQQLAELFASQLRNQDTVARWGGEEFLFILPQTTEEKAKDKAKKLLHAVRQHKFVCPEQPIAITISIGVEQLTLEQSLDACINSADRKLYQAKNSGRDQVCN